jgi:endonuclease/exonuclease/phosphatase family metal-dependent hydrolase
MKLITANIWGGIVYEPFVAFIEKQSADTDIFCFQEVLFGTNASFLPDTKARINIYSEIAARLPGFTSYEYFSPTKHFQTEPTPFNAGQAIFVRSSYEVKANGEASATMPDGGMMTGNCQWIDVATGSDTITIANLHGLWQQGTGKVDTPERLEQSRIVKEFLDSKPGRKILCGDFNLLPDGQSVAILEKDMKNLVKEFHVQSTRSSFYKKEGKFADYILVSPDVTVNDFKALPDEISDHLALYLDFK